MKPDRGPVPARRVTTIVCAMLAASMCVAVILWVRAEHRQLSIDFEQPRDLHEGHTFVGSERCAHCHEDHDRSWRRTYHRTMTQTATPETVLANFEDGNVDYYGWSASMSRVQDTFLMTVESPNGASVQYEIGRTVGSHRYQQYLARDGDAWWRVPWAWHIAEQRWFHMNGAFLTPDPTSATASNEDYSRHITRWDDNCIFCHNVGANPGFQVGEFKSHVAELGVACEACHGPGSEHAAANEQPWRRYALHGTEHADPTIINPARLSADRAADVCGHCHGQRITDDVEPFLAEGDPFVPGDDLARFSEPLWGDTTLHGNTIFGARFWPDGTPRLTAYEYQGWLQSACTSATSGHGPDALTCTTCHAMHDGDPEGQLRPVDDHNDHNDDEGNVSPDASCRSCHDSAQITGEHAGLGHPEVQCVDCHMPRVVYGVLDTLRSHRIDVPTAEQGHPNACALCHLLEPTTFFGLEHSNEPPPGLQWVFGGDPIERVVAADAFGRSPAVDDSRAAGILLAVLQHDAYPAVRQLAWRALRRRHSELDARLFDPLATPDVRLRQIETLRALIVHSPPSATTRRRLSARAQNVNIQIGE